MTSPFAAQPVVECPHGLRPGTTVCLRCRQDARAAARQRRVKLYARVGLVVMGAAVVVALIVGAWDAVASGRVASPQLTQSAGDAARPVALGQPAPRRVTTPAALEPTIAEGRRELGDSMYAVREGPQVTVNFDTENMRTRFDWKFEGIVRATLPLVFGPAVSTALDSIPSGTLARGDLLNDLPQRGIPIRVDTVTLRVWPVTRQGRDGPIVVAYRAAATR
jgi:hypothetical protein